MRVFISYASEDRELAEQVHLALIGAGHSTFFDKESLPPGDEYHTQIREAVEQSDALVFLVNSRSVSPSRYTLTELKYARAKWPHPKNRVLSVITEAIAFEKIPVYLKEATVLMPEGNLAAEVVYALLLMQRRSRPAKNPGWQPANWTVKKRIKASVLLILITASALIVFFKLNFPGNGGIGKWNYPVLRYLRPEEKQAGKSADAGTIINAVSNYERATVKNYPLLGKLWCGSPGKNNDPIVARATKSAGAAYSVDTSRHLLLGKDGEPVSAGTPVAIPFELWRQKDRKPVSDREPKSKIPVMALQTRRFLVTHCTGNGIDDYGIIFFSTHLVIDRDGAVKQLISFDAASLVSAQTGWQGITDVNKHSIGIKFVNWGRLVKKEGAWYSKSGEAIPAEEIFIYKTDDNASPTGWHKYTDQQIKAFFALTCALRRAYPGLTHLLGQDEISQVSKMYPGPAFPLQELAKRLYLKSVSDPIEEPVAE